MLISGASPDRRLVEMIELPEHPYFVGCQFHPEFKSRPQAPHPLFQSFIAAALRARLGDRRRRQADAARRRRLATAAKSPRTIRCVTALTCSAGRLCATGCVQFVYQMAYCGLSLRTHRCYNEIAAPMSMEIKQH